MDDLIREAASFLPRPVSPAEAALLFAALTSSGIGIVFCGVAAAALLARLCPNRGVSLRTLFLSLELAAPDSPDCGCTEIRGAGEPATPPDGVAASRRVPPHSR